MCDKQVYRDASKCQTCIIGKYEIPEMWCKNGCLETDRIPDEGVSCSGMPQLKIREDWKRQGKEMDYLLEDAPKPKTPYELLMEKQRIEQQHNPDITMWFIDEHCPDCGAPVYTDGKLQWCSKRCINFGKRNRQDKEWMEDLIR